MKTLVIYSRICPTPSLHTIEIFNQLKQKTNFEFYELGKNEFDIEKEQEYISKFDNIIFLFTINWFNIPWNLSRYFAEVWRTGNFNIENKNIYFIITTGSKKELYTHESDFKNTIDEYFNNSFSMIKRLKGNFIKSYVYHNCVEFDKDRLQAFIDEITLDLKQRIN